jgi:hypothetical protein
MSTALQEWREHRIDYRVPGLGALLLLLCTAFLLPADWLQLSWMGPAGSAKVEAPRFPAVEDEGLQILDVEVLAPAGSHPRLPDFEARRVEPGEDPSRAEEPEGGEGEFSWDPTHAYRLGDELLVPGAPEASDDGAEIFRRLEFLLSSEGAASYSLSDTSHAALAHTSFTRLQRELFLQSSPAWAYERAVERYRENMNRILLDNPLRGPQ